MSDELKDFRYYAEKAEASLKEARDYTSPKPAPETVDYMIRTAAVYAELAKAAPKAAPELPYVILTGAEAEMFMAMKGDQ
jgi:negative regulator of replication initiation